MARLFSFLGILVILGFVAAGYAYYDYSTALDAPINAPAAAGSGSGAGSGAGKLFTVQKGWSAKRTADELAAAGIIEKPHWFYLHARFQPQLTGRSASIKTGEYVLPQQASVSELFELLQTGQSKQYRHTVIEGTTFKQIIEGLPSVDFLAATDAINAPGSIMASLGLPDVHPEGQFFADTYSFPRDTTDLEFLRRANKSLQSVLAEEWEKREADLPYKNAYEALIMASIIEKETAVSTERPLIAGVFVSRLRKGMRLQTDPTVIYGIGDSYDGNIRRSDLRRDTPYNTYTRGGLPPTPIANVGREAIHAALHPENTTKLYFVSKGDGTHYFSETNEEHNAAVRKYQLKR